MTNTSLIREFSYDYFLGMSLTREFPHDNIYCEPKIKTFIPQQIVDKSTALSNKQFLCMHLCFKIDITKIFRCL